MNKHNTQCDSLVKGGGEMGVCVCVCVSVGERAGEGGREQITNKVRVERSAVQCLHNELMRTDELQTSPVTAGGDVGTQSTLCSGCGCGCGSWRHVGYCAVRLVRD